MPLGLGLEDPAAQPVAALARALAPDLAAARTGGFAADLVARDPDLAAVETPALGLSRHDPVEGTALTLALDAGRVTLWRDARMIDDATLALLADRLALFLDGLAAKPERPVGDLLALPARERALTLVGWNATRAETDLAPVHRAFEAQVDRTPDATALIVDDRSMSYAELDRRANALAHRLIAEGAQPGDRIGIYLARGFELMIEALAIHKVGAAYVPLDPAYPADRLAHYVTDSQATFVVTDLTLAAGLPPSDAVPVMVTSARDPDRPAVDLPADALAYVIYTSGSTGTPKGVQVEHRNLANFFTGMDALLAPNGTWLAVTSLGFDISVLELFYTLTRGYTVVIVGEAARITLSGTGAGEGDLSLSAQLTRHKATVLQCTPSMARMILADEGARAALGGLKQVLLGGEAVTASLTAEIRSLTQAQIVDMYGPTETTIWSTAHVVTGSETGVVPIGKPLANQTAYVLDARMQPVPVGLPGELWIGGLGVTRGYWQRDDLNADRFRPDPFAEETGVRRFETPRIYGTGDLVRWRVDGGLDFLGRSDHQVKIRGQRLELGEIEARINRADGVRQAVVVPKGEGGETRLVAYLEETGPGAADPAAIRADLVAHLPEVMVPAQFVVLAALPLTPNRKVDRKALPDPDDAPHAVPDIPLARTDDGPPPGEGLEAQIAAIWAQVLGIDDIRAGDSFFALGGQSLQAVAALGRIQALPGLDTTAITEIFRFPVLRDLAAHLAQTTGHAAPGQAPVTLPGFDRAAIMARRRALRLKSGRAAA
ncbi:MAG: non-ribosomal peptide synthetase [Paracoccaceae bacterium]